MNSTNPERRRPSGKREVLKIARESGVRFVRLVFADIFGVGKNVSIPIDELEAALEGRVTFDGGSIDGFVRGEELDMLLRPGSRDLRALPMARASRRTRGASHLRYSDARRVALRRLPPHDAAPRHREREGARRLADRARSRVLSLRAIERRCGLHGHARRRFVLRLLRKRSRRGGAQRDRRGAPGDGRADCVRAPRARRGPARDRRRARRPAGCGRPRHDPAHDRKARRGRFRSRRYLHAQTAGRARGQRPAR